MPKRSRWRVLFLRVPAAQRVQLLFLFKRAEVQFMRGANESTERARFVIHVSRVVLVCEVLASVASVDQRLAILCS